MRSFSMALHSLIMATIRVDPATGGRHSHVRQDAVFGQAVAWEGLTSG